MKHAEAIDIVKTMSGRQYGYMKDWGLSTIKEAVRTLQNRKLTKDEQAAVDSVAWKIQRKY